MKLRITGVLLAVCVLPFLIETNSGCGFQAGSYPEKEPTNSYECACTCVQDAPRHRTLRINLSEDDAEQQLDGTILLNSPDLDFQNGRLIGLRFRDIDIPKGSHIASANLDFIAALLSGAGTLTVQIAAEAADNPLLFATTNSNLSTRIKTMNPEAWNLNAAWTVGSTHTTPNFSAVLQQIVDRPGWVPGNDIVILITGTAGATVRKAFSYNGQSTAAPLLTIEYEEPVLSSIGPIPIQACVLPVDNVNIGGVQPDMIRLNRDCTERVGTTFSGLARTCGYPSQCTCTVTPDSQKYAGKCDEPCVEVPLSMNPKCDNFDPVNGNVTATNDPNDPPVCIANSPLASAMYGRRTTCEVEGHALVMVDGEVRMPDASGIVKFVGDPCPGGSCPVGMEYNVDIDSVTFGNFLKSATFSDLGSLGETTAGNEAIVAANGDGTYSPTTFDVSAQGRRGSDSRGVLTTNDDHVDINVAWGTTSPTCSIEGTLVGGVDPELKRCENAGPTANMECEDESQCIDDPACSDEVCNCEDVEDSEILLGLDVSGDIINQPPTADAGADQEIECTDAAVNNVVLDGSDSSDLDGNIALYSWLRGNRVGEEVGFDPVSKLEQSLGAETYFLRVIDGFGEADEDSVEVGVVDNTPPVVTCAVAAPLLNQSNHNMVNVGLTGAAVDQCEGELPVTVSVFADEDDEEHTGDGKHSPDAKDIDVGSLRLRAERKNSSDGRVYLMIVEATDSSGNRDSACCTVGVPSSNRHSAQTAALAQANAARAFCEANDGTAPAGYFVVGDGPIVGPKQ